MKKTLGLLFILIFVTPVIAGAYMGDGYGFGMMGFGGGFMTLMWAVWLVVGVLVAVWLWQQISKK